MKISKLQKTSKETTIKQAADQVDEKELKNRKSNETAEHQQPLKKPAQEKKSEATPKKNEKVPETKKIEKSSKEGNIKDSTEKVIIEPIKTRKCKVHLDALNIEHIKPNEKTLELKTEATTEPLKTIEPSDNNLLDAEQQVTGQTPKDESNNSIKPRITRGRVEQTKSNESMAKEESKEKDLEIIEITEPKFTVESSTSEKNDNKKEDKSTAEENLILMKSKCENTVTETVEIETVETAQVKGLQEQEMNKTTKLITDDCSQNITKELEASDSKVITAIGSPNLTEDPEATEDKTITTADTTQKLTEETDAAKDKPTTTVSKNEPKSSESKQSTVDSLQNITKRDKESKGSESKKLTLEDSKNQTEESKTSDNKKSENEDSKNQTEKTKSIESNEPKNETEEKHFEPRKTRSRGDLIKEVDKEKNVELTEEKALPDDDSKNQTEEEHLEPRKTTIRGELKEEVGKENFKATEETTPTQDDDKNATEKEYLEKRKTESLEEVKEELEKEKLEASKVETSIQDDAKSKLEQEHLEAKKTESHEDLKEEVGKEKQQASDLLHSSTQDDVKSETEKELLEPRKTKSRGDLKVEIGKETHEITQAETSDEKTSKKVDAKNETEEADLEPRKTRSRKDIKAEVDKGTSENTQMESDTKSLPKNLTFNDSINETEAEKFEPRKTRSRADFKKDADCTAHAESSTEKVSKCHDDLSKQAEVNLVPIKTRRRGDLTGEVEKDAETSKNTSSNQMDEEHFEPRQTRSRDISKIAVGKETASKIFDETSSTQDVARNQMDELHFEPRKTRSREHPKSEVDKETIKVTENEPLQERVEQHFEVIKTNNRKDIKENAEKETTSESPSLSNDEKDEHTTETRITRKRVDLKGELRKEKAEASQNVATSKIILPQDDSKKEHSEPIKTRRNKGPKAEVEKEKTEKNLSQENSKNVTEEEHFEPIKTRRRGEHKEEAQKETTEISQVETSCEKSSTYDDSKNQTEEKHFEPIKTRNQEDHKEESEKETTHVNDAKNETEESQFEPVKTRRRGDQKLDSERETTKITSSEKSSTQDQSQSQAEEQHFDPIKTRKRGDLRSEACAETSSISDNSYKSTRPKDLKGTTEILNVETAENQTEKYDLEHVQTRGRSERKIETTHSTGKTKYEILETLSSTADETPAEENKEIAEPSTSKVINFETSKTHQDNFSLEADMSGSESSITSSNSDSTLRRTLRKRATESPFPENDNRKKIFKQPPLKSAATLLNTPKSTKIDRPSSTALGTSIKRSLRSPASLEAENQNLSKKPKLDTSRKSTRFSNLHDDCLEEEELPIVTVNVSVLANEQDYLQEQQGASCVQDTNLKTLQNKNTEKVKEPLKTTGNKEKKIEEKVKYDEKLDTTPQSSTKVLQKKVLHLEEKKQNTNKDQVKTNPDKNDNSTVTNAQESSDLAKSNKAKDVIVSPTKSASSTAVLSFSDWLKTKKENAASTTTAGAKVAVSLAQISTTITKENTPEIAKQQSKVKAAQPTPDVLDSKPTDDNEQEMEVAETPQEEPKSVSQRKKKVSGMALATNKQELDATDANDSVKSTDESHQLDNSLLQPLENQMQNALKRQKTKSRSKKANVKRLNTSSKNSAKMQASPIAVKKSNNPTISPPKIKVAKKNEIELLIESMSKEMKEGGINDLLNTNTHVKRQRVPVKRIMGDSEHFNTTREAASATPIPQANTSSLKLSRETPIILDFSDNSEVLTTSINSTPKSPTKRKPTQNAAKSKKPSTSMSAMRAITGTPDIFATAKPAVLQESAKVLATKSRKSLNIKELPQQVTKTFETVATVGAVKSRKSMPITFKESLNKNANIAIDKISRKSLEISKSQKATAAGDHNRKKTSEVFKTPKQPAHSTILNLIPSPDSIKKLYEDTKKRPDSRIKIFETASRLKTFKCRKLRVRLNRSIVRKYWNSINNRQKQIDSRIQQNLGNVSGVSTCPAEVLPVIQNNSEINLRIQSVVDASTLLNTAPAASILSTQELPARPNIIPCTGAMQTSLSIPMPAISQPYILPSTNEPVTPLTTPLINVTNESIELKNEFMDENPMGLINDAILPDTPTLLARAQTITEAAQHALSSSVTPTDIRLLTADSTANSYVPSFGVTPTALDNRGTCMYTFLHPAKYNRNHSNVLLDYCCPNLDGPMPAIDPTRIHAQVQVPVIELPASIVLTTKVVTRADLESGNSSIPAIIRKKAEKIRKNLATHTKMAVITTATTSTTTNLPTVAPVMAQPSLVPTPRPALPPTINALTKQLPATTTITAKVRPSLPPPTQPVLASSATPTIPKSTTISVIPKGQMSQLSNVQTSSLRSNLRRFDVLLKQLVQPFDNLNFVERHRIIETLISSGKFLPKDLDRTLVLMEEYLKQTMLIVKNNSLNNTQTPPTSAILSSNDYVATQPIIAGSSSSPNPSTNINPLPAKQMPQLQPSPNILAASAATTTSATSYSKQFELYNKAVRKVQSRTKNTTSTTSGGATSGVIIKQRQVPIYDTDRNIIGYQMQMMSPMSTIPAYTKSTMSTHSGAIMSTSLDSSSNKITSYSVSKRPVKRPAQDSPRVFYTTPPLKTSTPKTTTNPPPPSHMYPTTQHSKNAASSSTIAKKTQGSIVTTIRSGGSTPSGSSETITTTTMATVKRVTRSTATGSKIIIVSKSNQSSEETILPDSNSNQQQQPEPEQRTEIKNEEDIEDFLG